MAVTPSHSYSASSKRLTSWYLVVRMLVVCLLLGGTILYQLQHGSWTGTSSVRFLSYLTLISIVLTFLSAVILERITSFRHFIHSQLSWDLAFVCIVVYLTGGVESQYPFLYILVIIASSVFLPRSQVLVVAAAASILYGSLLDLQYYGYIPIYTVRPLPVKLHHYDIFYAVFLHVGAFFLTALLSGALAERLRRSEEAREKREIDYDELERLNQEILSNMNSGLMVVNSSGRIRLFNNSASKITGLKLEEVYNRPIEAIFPEFDKIDLNRNDRVDRGELLFRKDADSVLTLGYSASKVVDRRTQNLGMLIAFQDLTEFKELEDQLKRSDRLAAVGRLASGLAHEIRNPLASISGSIQLLLEDKNVREEDRKLMNIVVKEADRLSMLLSDFLNFARPAPLQAEIIDLAALVDELVALLRAGGQFESVSIEKEHQGPIMANVDPQKMRQVLWDLLLNAVEAVSDDGTVRISILPEEGEIQIEDTGTGIHEEDQDKLFEPFFTTKDKGTGLGLANVYANIEAHKGRIYVEPSNHLGGARFIIELPEGCWQ